MNFSYLLAAGVWLLVVGIALGINSADAALVQFRADLRARAYRSCSIRRRRNASQSLSPSGSGSGGNVLDFRCCL